MLLIIILTTLRKKSAAGAKLINQTVKANNFEFKLIQRIYFQSSKHVHISFSSYLELQFHVVSKMKIKV